MNRYIRDGSLSRKPLSENQHAYQTEMELNIVVSSPEAQVCAGDFAIWTVKDIEGTSKNTSRATIEAFMRRYKVPLWMGKPRVGEQSSRSL